MTSSAASNGTIRRARKPARSAISCDSDERALKYVVDDLKGENIVWNTDYPHPDAINPKRALPDLDAQPISDEAKRKILWDNAVKLFGARILN